MATDKEYFLQNFFLENFLLTFSQVSKNVVGCSSFCISKNFTNFLLLNSSWAGKGFCCGCFWRKKPNKGRLWCPIILQWNTKPKWKWRFDVEPRSRTEPKYQCFWCMFHSGITYIFHCQALNSMYYFCIGPVLMLTENLTISFLSFPVCLPASWAFFYVYFFCLHLNLVIVCCLFTVTHKSILYKYLCIEWKKGCGVLKNRKTWVYYAVEWIWNTNWWSYIIWTY